MSQNLNILDLRTISDFNKYAIEHWDDVEEFIVIGRCKNEYFRLTKCNKKGFAEVLRNYLKNDYDTSYFFSSTTSALELSLCSLELGVDFTELMQFIYRCHEIDDPEKLDKEIDDFIDTLYFD